MKSGSFQYRGCWVLLVGLGSVAGWRLCIEVQAAQAPWNNGRSRGRPEEETKETFGMAQEAAKALPKKSMGTVS